MAPRIPTLRRERALWQSGAGRVAGVDEVGVAPACGPVVAAAVILRPNSRRIPGVRDSKTLSAAQREALAPEIRRRALAVGVGAASVAEIDRLNIYHATHLAMRRALARLGGHDHVLVDGLRIAGFEADVGPYDAIVDGDGLVYSIACASIVAKVVRDGLMARLAERHPGYGWERNAGMARLAERHPGYGWERNAGYATREHRLAMAELGVTAFHRRSFITTRRAIEGVEQLGFGLVPVGPGRAPGEAAAAAPGFDEGLDDGVDGEREPDEGAELLAAWEAERATRVG
jgi:ribonuclease HII